MSEEQEEYFHSDDNHHNGDEGAHQNSPPDLSLPPPITPHVQSGDTSSILHLIHYLQISREQEETRRAREEEERRRREETFRLQLEQQRQEDQRRFLDLCSLIAGQRTSQTSPDPSQAPVQTSPPQQPSSPQVTTTKPSVSTPPSLQPDVTYQVFRQWRVRFEDYAVLIGLSSMNQATQQIHLRTCISLEVQRVLQHTLGIPPDTSLSVKEVLDSLQKHFRGQRNEALRRREMLSCKQAEGESFADYYARLKDLADEVDLCPGDPAKCADLQIKMILLMGVRDEDLLQRLVSLEATSTLSDFVTCCRSYEATRATASALTAAPSQLNAVSSYKKDQRQQKITANTSTGQQTIADVSCQCCFRQHDLGKCPAAKHTCSNCGRTGHWTRTPKCPAKDAQCHACNRKGHFSKHCRSSKKTSDDPSNCRRVGDASADRSPKPVSVRLSYGSTSSNFLMIPYTGADITVIGTTHLEALNIPRSSLSPPPMTEVLTADGSSMTPAVGCFQAELKLGTKSCLATIQVHEGIQTPLLSCGNCQDLAIVPQEFPKPILSVTHVNRCTQLPVAAMSSPAAAKEFFLRHFSDVLVSKSATEEDVWPTNADPPEAGCHALRHSYTQAHSPRLQGSGEAGTRFPGAAGDHNTCTRGTIRQVPPNGPRT